MDSGLIRGRFVVAKGTSNCPLHPRSGSSSATRTIAELCKHLGLHGLWCRNLVGVAIMPWRRTSHLRQEWESGAALWLSCAGCGINSAKHALGRGQKLPYEVGQPS